MIILARWRGNGIFLQRDLLSSFESTRTIQMGPEHITWVEEIWDQWKKIIILMKKLTNIVVGALSIKLSVSSVVSLDKLLQTIFLNKIV